MKDVTVVLKNVDWKLLQQQKITLVDLASNPALDMKYRNAADGLINLLDFIQDAAVETGQLKVGEVFGKAR